MSSHHVVRDQQEPALIIKHLNEIDHEILGQLLEWSPTVLAIGNAVSVLTDLGIKVDIAIAPADQPENQSDIETIELPADTHPVQFGLNLLFERNYGASYGVGLDLTIFEFIGLAHQWQGKLELVLINGNNRLTYHAKPYLQKWVNAGDSFSIFPTEDATIFTTEGFIDNLENELLSDQCDLIAQEAGFVSIQSNLKPFILREDIL